MRIEKFPWLQLTFGITLAQKMKKLVKQALRIYLNILCLMELKTTTVSILNLLKK